LTGFKKNIILVLFLLIFLFCFLYAEEMKFIKITTVKDVLKNMTEKYETIKYYKANFYIRSITDKVESWSKKTLKLYVPQLNVLGEQSLEEYRPGFLISGKASLHYLKKKFNFSFNKSNKPEIINEMPYYVLKLTQKEVTAGFKEIILYVSEHWIMTKAKATTLSGNEITIRFGNIVINRRITEHEFEFSLPVNTQTIKNPLFYKLEGE